MEEAEMVERLLAKVRVCDVALANLTPHVSDAGRIRLEQAIVEVRADAVGRLRALGRDIGTTAAS
jgi:hypothetical protein